jgi:hypothetical protein
LRKNESIADAGIARRADPVVPGGQHALHHVPVAARTETRSDVSAAARLIEHLSCGGQKITYSPFPTGPSLSWYRPTGMLLVVLTRRPAAEHTNPTAIRPRAAVAARRAT